MRVLFLVAALQAIEDFLRDLVRAFLSLYHHWAAR